MKCKKTNLICIALALLSQISIAQKRSVIEIQSTYTSNDTLDFRFFESLNIKESVNQRINLKNGFYKIDLPGFRQIAYYSLALPGKRALLFYPVEEGDSIFIKVTPNEVFFSGQGAGPAIFMYEQNQYFTNIDNYINFPFTLDNYLDALEARTQNAIKKLNEYKEQLTPLAYLVLRAEIIGLVGFKKIQNLMISSINEDEMKKLYKKKVLTSEINYNDNFALNWHYVSFIYQKSLMDQITEGLSIDGRTMYEVINKNYSGLLKEKLVVYHLTNMIRKGIDVDVDYCVQNYLSSNNFSDYKEVVSNEYSHFKVSLASGTSGDSFTLFDEKRQPVLLSEFNDKVVLIDFWFPGCTGCREMTPAMTEVEKKFKGDSNVLFVSIAVHPDKEDWLTIIAKGLFAPINSKHLFTGEIGFEHPILKFYNVTAYPRLVLLFKGRIINVNATRPDKDNGQMLIKSIRELSQRANEQRVVIRNKSSMYSRN